MYHRREDKANRAREKRRPGKVRDHSDQGEVVRQMEQATRRLSRAVSWQLATRHRARMEIGNRSKWYHKTGSPKQRKNHRKGTPGYRKWLTRHPETQQAQRDCGSKTGLVEEKQLLLLLDLKTRARCDRDTALRRRSENHGVCDGRVEVRQGMHRRGIVVFAGDAGAASRRGVDAGVLVEVVVSAETLVARREGAKEGLVVGVDGADVTLEVLATLEALATARHLARVDLAALAKVVHLLGLVGHTTTARTLGDEASVRVGKVGKVAVEAHALRQHRQTGSLSGDVLDVDLSRRRRSEHRGNGAGHAKRREGRRASCAAGRRGAGRAVRVEARSIGSALGEDHRVRASIAEERVGGVRLHGHRHGHAGSVGTSEEAEAGFATDAPVVTMARLIGSRPLAEGEIGI